MMSEVLLRQRGIRHLNSTLKRIPSSLMALSKNRAAGRYAIAFVGQGMLSASTFITNLLLIRLLSSEDYGLYALAVACAHFGMAVNNALSSGPLAVFGTRRVGRPSRAAIETLVSSVNLMIVGSVFLISVAAAKFDLNRSLSIDVGFSLYVAAFTARSYSRNFAYARQRPEVALAGDISLAGGSLATFGAVFTLPALLGLHAALYGLSASYFLAMAVEFILLRVGTRLALRRRSLRQYRPIWRQVRWSLLGSTTSIAQSQSHSFLVSSIAGTAALAPLAAGQVTFAPIRVVNAVLINVMLPEVVVAIARNDRTLVLRTLWLLTLILALGVAALGVIVVVAWDFIFMHLYFGKYAEDSMKWICGVWSLIVLCNAISSTPYAILFALLEFRLVALGGMFASIISVSGAFLLTVLLSPTWSLVGVLAGEIFLLIYAVILIQRRMRNWR
jgi:O-antigen/teichoic acid export membrane protein